MKHPGSATLHLSLTFFFFLFSISAVVMSYLQNPSPMTLPFST
jgi:hypothetical protein